MKPPYGVGKEKWFWDNGYGRPRGTIHVGVNDGTELGWYLQEGQTPVLGFEPIPEVFQQTCKNFHAEILNDLIRLENIALGDLNGEMLLGLFKGSNGVWDTNGASGYKINDELAKTLGWESPVEKMQVKVLVCRFFDWAVENNIDITPYDLLVIDVQGMELEVLKGFGDLSSDYTSLAGFKYLVVECSDPPIYEGEATAQEVELFLAEKDFRRMSPILSHDDVLFLNNRYA